MFQFTHVRPARVLEDPQTELGKDRQQVVEDIRLNGLIACPGDGVGEAVEFQRQAICGWVHLPDQLGHLLVDTWVLTQVVLDVSAEGADVGDPPGICWLLAGLCQCAVPAEQLALLAVQVLAEQQKTLQAGDLLWAEEADTGLVKQQATFDPPSTGFLHPAPILERVADKAFGRDGGDGFVPVLYV